MRIVLRGALLAFALTSSAFAQSVSITGGVPVVESFSIMAGAQNTTASTLPSGWALSESGSGANTTYLIDDGSSQSGNTFSYGAAGAPDRALGALGSGSVVSTFGARLQNDTGAMLAELLFQFTTEQWRQGTPAGADRLNFQYCVTTCTLADLASDTDWINFDALDAIAPLTNLAEGTKLDGNLPANRVAVSGTLSGLTLAAGAQIWIRWYDTNDASVDDALAIDDFSVGLAVDNPPQLASSTPEQGEIDVPAATAITLNFSEAVTTSPDPWFTLDCGGIVAAAYSGSGAARTVTANANLPFNTSCTLTLINANITDTDGTADALVGSNSFSFTTVADNAPTVQGITPADGAINVAVNANVSVNFSEAVDAVGNWITLICSISGAQPGVISGADASYAFNPTNNLSPGDICTTTLTAASITDRDGVPQMLSGANVFGFTVAPDIAPTLASTFPADAAVNVAIASNLTATFSEPVTVTGNAFAIQCGATAHTYVATTSNQLTYTLNPDSDFALNVSCTLTIFAAEITDIDGAPNTLSGADVVIDFMTSAGTSGYYERVDVSSCRAMRATLHGVIDDHTSYPYSAGTTDTFDIVEAAEQDPADSTRILDVYRNRKYLKGTDRSGGTGPTTFNREHTWPKSLGFPSETGDMGLPNAPHTDTHMLYASASDYNSTRSNNPYRDCPSAGSCSAETTDVNYGNGGGSGFPGQSNWTGGSYYHTWNKRQGDVARAVLYMDVRYEGGTNSKTGQSEPDLVLTYGSDAGTPGNLTTLLGWHNADAPANAMSANVLDNLEPTRNDVIESFQGNRNPLIDHPEWAETLFTQPCLGPAVVAVDDDFTVNQDTTLIKGAPGVLRDDHNGVSKNGQGLTATLSLQAISGIAAITDGATGAFSYIPTAGFCGSDRFTYEVTNGSVIDQGVVHIVVTCTTPDILPTAVADNVNVTEDSGSNALDVLGNDTNPDGGPRTVQSVTQPVGGVVAIGAGNANVTFTPNANFCTTTSFNYTVNGGSSTTVTVTMTCVNDAPTTVGVLSSQNYTVGAMANIATATAFTDVDDATLTYTATNLPPSLTIDLNSGAISGTLAAGDIGVFNVAVTAHDLALPSAAQNFTISVAALPNAIFENGFE